MRLEPRDPLPAPDSRHFCENKLHLDTKQLMDLRAIDRVVAVCDRHNVSCHTDIWPTIKRRSPCRKCGILVWLCVRAEGKFHFCVEMNKSNMEKWDVRSWRAPLGRCYQKLVHLFSISMGWSGITTSPSELVTGPVTEIFELRLRQKFREVIVSKCLQFRFSIVQVTTKRPHAGGKILMYFNFFLYGRR